jgi:hypothetical protein
MCRRTASRVAFGKPISEQTVTQERIAEARIMIEQARLLTLNAAHAMDTVGNKVAKAEIAMIKVAVPNMACQIVDWAIQRMEAEVPATISGLPRPMPPHVCCGWPMVPTKSIATRSPGWSCASTGTEHC